MLAQIERELESGRKTSHWMWFVFPQLAGLGRSNMAERFALHSLEEARAYAAHETLGSRLRRHTALVTSQDTSLFEIFGTPDDLKFHSSMSLFHLAVPEDAVFRDALSHFRLSPDPRTAALLRRSS